MYSIHAILIWILGPVWNHYSQQQWVVWFTERQFGAAA